ncbi:TolC family protein [bacterium]|nr:TolC family protein [bacterium]
MLAMLLLLAARAAAAADPVVKSLTLTECIERALEQNLAVRVQRIEPQIADWAITGAQGAFDPDLTGRVNYEDASEPLNPERATALGLNSIESQQLRLSSGLEGKLPTGTGYALSVFDTRSEGTLAADAVHVGAAALTLTQPLLKDFWLGPNTATIRVARQVRAVAGHQFAEQVMAVVSDVQVAYYELAFAIQDRQAAQEDLARARALLAENRRRLEVGVLSPLEVTQAEAGAANREEAVIIAAQTIRERSNDLKRLISRDVREWRGVTLVPAETPPLREVATDFDRSLRTALAQRPDYLTAQAELDRRGILRRYNHNQLWPRVDLEGSYGYNGIGGSFGRVSDSIASGDDPAWSIGVVVRIPLGNRVARAAYATARLEEERAVLQFQQLEQQIIVEVDNAVGQVQTARERVAATAVAVRLAEQSVEVESEKLRAGKSTSLLVLDAQAQLAAARSAQIRARADYYEALVELARIEGTTLQEHGIELDGLAWTDD